MKNCITVLCLLASVCYNAYAGAARRYVLLEHFTQAGCGPCALFNPGFEREILHRNPGSVHHISYHTSWPGFDPMYNYNPGANDARTSYYGIGGVPQVIILGDNTAAETFEGSQEMIDSIVTAGSPLAVIANESENNGLRSVQVQLTSMDTPPAGEYVLHIAVVERLVEYVTPPGSNGERSFVNVLRTMLPSAQGTPTLLPEPGQSAEYSFQYALDPAWNANEIYVVAFVQNTATLEVLNSGASRDLKANLTSSIHGQVASGSTPVVFDLAASNDQDYERTFRIRLFADAPKEWSVSLLADNKPTGDGFVTIGPRAMRSIELTVTPSGEAAVGTYTIELSSDDEPDLVPAVQKVYVVHRVTNLVVSNDMRWSDSYRVPLAGLNAGVGVIDAEGFGKVEKNIWSGVRSVYYNAGWSFPTLTDRSVAMLQQVIDRGGNVFIAGQDIGWDQVGSGVKHISDSVSVQPGGTPATRRFFQEYLQSGLYSDGLGMKSVVALKDDAVLGSVAVSQLENVHGVPAPDILVPVGNAVPALMYGEEKDNIAGQRHTRGLAKIVYFGFGLEMLGNEKVRDDMMAAVYEWFEGTTSSVEFDHALQSAGVVCFPNPAGDELAVAVSDVSYAQHLVVSTVYGLDVINLPVAPGSAIVRFSTRELSAGLYAFRIMDNGVVKRTGTFQIIR